MRNSFGWQCMRAVQVAHALAAPPNLFSLSSKFVTMTILYRAPSMQQILPAAKLIELFSKDHHIHVAVRACGLQ